MKMDKTKYVYNLYLIAFRHTHKLSQRQVADYLGISIKTVQAWERAQNRCPKMVYLALRNWERTGIL